MPNLEYRTDKIPLADAQLLMEEFIAESIFGGARKNVALSPFKLNLVLHNEKVFKCVVYDEDTPVAIFMGANGSHTLFEGVLAYEIANFVAKSHRGGMIAVRLIKMFEKWCKENGSDGISLGQSSGSVSIDMVRGLYERMGYTVTGFNAIKEL